MTSGLDPLRPIRMLGILKYDSQAASARQRLLQYVPALDAAGIAVDWIALFDNRYLQDMNAGRRRSRVRIVKSYLRRLRELPRARTYDVAWIQYEFLPWLPGIAERLGAAFARTIVLDYDDAIFHQYDIHRSRLVRAFVGGKLQPLMQRAAACGCGNEYLADYARRFCADVRILPTVVDVTRYVPAARRPEERPVTIGWIGSPSTWRYVAPMVPLLQELVRRLGVRVRVVGAGKLGKPAQGIDLIEWSEEDEIAEIQAMDIGIMPLPDELWTRGKCGYKLIQYMACGLPVVASPVGVNSTIVDHGRSGFLASTPEAFVSYIEQLVANPALRTSLGAEGRARAERDYSLQTHAPRFVQMIRDAVKG